MLNNMQGGSKAVFGLIMGAMAAFDFGGPVNKVASFLLMDYYYKVFMDQKLLRFVLL